MICGDKKGMNFIEARNISHDYILRDENDRVTDVNHALDDVSLDINEGDFIAILGRNGSGKSTFAKHLNGIELPTQGDVLVYGLNTKDEDKLLDIRKNVGMVFQNPDNQIIANVVEEDVAFGPENIGIPTDEIWQRVNESLENVGMTAYRLSSPNKLSGGQKQRVAIAGVMAMRPKCIVLDEPTAMLDPNGRKEVLRTIKELNVREGITIVLITHYMEEAVYADKVIIMDKGKLFMSGTAREIFSKGEKLREKGLDVPQVTEIAERLGLGTALTVEELVDGIIKARKS